MFVCRYTTIFNIHIPICMTYFCTWSLYHPHFHMRFFSSLKPEYKDKQFYLVQSANASESKEGALLTGSEFCIDVFFKESCELFRDLCFAGSLPDNASPHDSYLTWHPSCLTAKAELFNKSPSKADIEGMTPEEMNECLCCSWKVRILSCIIHLMAMSSLSNVE